ncbi:MAG: bifunctional riboflavin kinase/FAD synthetase [Chloroflexota bacterium]
MPVEEELARLAPETDMLLTIGIFDGVHLGHRKLLSELISRAREQGIQSGVVTFTEHPEKVFRPEIKLPYLTDIKERTDLLKDAGVDRIIALPFTRELAEIRAEHFIRMLIRHLKMCGLVIGADFALGREREGNASALKRLGEEIGFSVVVVAPVTINGEVVSSTAIRDALTQGDMKKVASLTGRLFTLKKTVRSGAGRGRTIGFPTANLEIDPGQALPADGVYATMTEIDGASYKSMTYIGERPTFSIGQRAVEVYLLDYQGNLYGKELKNSFIERLRHDKKFATPEELKAQIAKDIRQGKAILNSQGKN